MDQMNSNGDAEKSLYQRLGGYDAIAAVVDGFLERVYNDLQLERYFEGISEKSSMRTRQLTVDMVCNATGGPCYYTGRDMKTVHVGMGINESDWELAVNYLIATLGKFKIPAQ